MEPVLAGFKDYLPLLIFFAIWWISSKKKKAVRRQTDTSPPASVARGDEGFNLQNILRQLLTGQVEMPRPAAHPSKAGRPEVPAARQSARQRLDDSADKWTESDTGSEEPAAITPGQLPTSLPAAAVAQGPVPVHRAACHSYVAKKMHRQALRRAVIWSEILGPPVSLRD